MSRDVMKNLSLLFAGAALAVSGCRDCEQQKKPTAYEACIETKSDNICNLALAEIAARGASQPKP